jgi:flagellin
MSLRINHNIQAHNAHRSLSTTSERVAKSMERLSSGIRINRGGDDAAGLGISERMRGQIRGLAQAQRNTQDGISMVQTAEGSLAEVHLMLQRVRELAVQYKNGTLAADDRTAIMSEVNQLRDEVERIGQQAQFNGISLLNQAVTITFQVGANDRETISVATISLSGSVSSAAFSLSSLSTGNDITEIDLALTAISTQRAVFGAVQNRFEHTLNALGAYQENLVAAESRIRDVDMAEEMVSFTKDNILVQAGQSMLAQANQAPQSILQLLQG